MALKQRTSIALAFASAFLVILLNGSTAAAVEFRETKHRISAIKPNMARLYFYRVKRIGGAYHPDVNLNGQLVWASESGAVARLDVPEGSYLVNVEGHELRFNVYASEIKYINLGPRSGGWRFRFGPQLIDAKYAERNIDDLDYIELTADLAAGGSLKP